MRYTIEARELTSDSTRRTANGGEPETMVVDAFDADDAISRFVTANGSELVSFTRPKGGESIATVRKDDLFFLVRIYAN